MARAIAECKCRTCGESFVRIKYDCKTRKDAEDWESWAETAFTECTECWKKRKDNERRAENEAAAKAAEQKSRPALTGSEKQIAWATTIREKALAWTEAVPVAASTEQSKQNILRWMEGHTSASWWIDRRDCVSSEKQFPVFGLAYFVREYKKEQNSA